MQTREHPIEPPPLGVTTAALERLGAKDGVTLGRMPRSDPLVTLALASLCLPTERRVSEAEVNAALKTWLHTTGSMLRADHVELRRTLIDFDLWKRDGFGRAYGRAPAVADAALAAHLAHLAAVDAPRIVAEQRARRSAERAERKARATARAQAG
jgi:hypothetical protein